MYLPDCTAQQARRETTAKSPLQVSEISQGLFYSVVGCVNVVFWTSVVAHKIRSTTFVTFVSPSLKLQIQPVQSMNFNFILPHPSQSLQSTNPFNLFTLQKFVFSIIQWNTNCSLPYPIKQSHPPPLSLKSLCIFFLKGSRTRRWGLTRNMAYSVLLRLTLITPLSNLNLLYGQEKNVWTSMPHAWISKVTTQNKKGTSNGRAIKKVDEANYYLKQVISLRKLTPQSLEFANASSASVCLPTTWIPLPHTPYLNIHSDTTLQGTFIHPREESSVKKKVKGLLCTQRQRFCWTIYCF